MNRRIRVIIPTKNVRNASRILCQALPVALVLILLPLGKLNFYLEALDRNVRKAHEQPSIGVLLCASKNDEVVEYALAAVCPQP